MSAGKHYTTIANPPEKAKDDTSVGAKNGQLSRTGSLTVLRRTNSKKTACSTSSSRSHSTVSFDSDSLADLNTEKLPPIDTPEASHICSLRLRHIAQKLEKDEITKEDLRKNLEYAASVLETVYIDETSSPVKQYTPEQEAPRGLKRSPEKIVKKEEVFKDISPYLEGRRLCDEDDDLSEVEPDAVPSEVRDWLALTFTRSMANSKRKGEDKPRFRSVAHAIRAGIMVDRIYRRMSSTVGLHVPPQVLVCMKQLDDWSFNVFGVSDCGEGHALKYVGYELLQKYDLLTKFKINTTHLDNFLLGLEAGYSKYKNPYHNLVHGADVTQTVHHILSQSKLAQWLTDIEMFASIIAALIHDYEHTGTTNNFHIMTSSEVALLYNDKAVLENHHICAAFKVMRAEESNILSCLSKEEYREFRSLVIEMVLATDMSFHFQQLKNMKNLLGMPENIEKSKALALVLHCADISHPAKDWNLHERWTKLLLEEFFRQGEREQELGLPFSPLCDRKNTLVAESQIGFIEFIVEPSFNVMSEMLLKIVAPLLNPPTSRQDDTILEETSKKDKCTSTTSLNNTATPPTKSPKTPKSGARYELKKPWVACLQNNKSQWKERAVKDAEERKKSEASNTSNNSDSSSSEQPKKIIKTISRVEQKPELVTDETQTTPKKADTDTPSVHKSNSDAISSKESSTVSDIPPKSLYDLTAVPGRQKAPLTRSRALGSDGSSTGGSAHSSSSSEGKFRRSADFKEIRERLERLTEPTTTSAPADHKDFDDDKNPVFECQTETLV